jgi:uncharacterized protein DUF3800
MVCGLTAREREKRLMGILTCYADDSGSDPGTMPAFVLAGYVAGVEQWKKFLDQWDIALKSGPRVLEYFKMVEAHWKIEDGQFYGWSDHDRDAKLIELGRIIKDHVMYGVRVVLYWDDYQTVRAKYPNYQVEPYTILYHNLMISSILRKIDLDIDDPIKFIFDQQGAFGKRARGTFDDAVSMSTIPSFFLRHIAGPPNFEDDKDFLPLQSADLLAWQTRRFCDDHSLDGPLHAEYRCKPPLEFLDTIPCCPTKVLDLLELEELFSMWKAQYPLGIS